MLPMRGAAAMGLQLTAILAAALCGTFAPRDMVELLHFNYVFPIVGGAAVALGLILMRTLKHAAALWLGHSVLCTGGAAVVAAWAATSCDQLVRVVTDDSSSSSVVVPNSRVGFDVVVVERLQQCDTGTEYAAAGRRAAVSCCCIVVFSLVSTLMNQPRPQAPKRIWMPRAPQAPQAPPASTIQQTVTAAAALGGLFAAIVCNEDDWDWRALYAIAIALAIASFFATGANFTMRAEQPLGSAVANGWSFWLDDALLNLHL